MKLDMHFHSTSSDGLLTKEQLILKAKAKNLDFIALTDHDVVSYDFRELAQEKSIQSCQSVEISAFNKRDDKSLHLTLYANQISKNISDILSWVISKKMKLIEKQIKYFAEIGFNIDINDFYDYFKNMSRNPDTLNKFDIVFYMFLDERNKSLAMELNDWQSISVEGFYQKFLKKWWEKFSQYAVQVDQYEVWLDICKKEVESSNWILAIPHPHTTFRKWWINEFKKVLPYYIESAWVNAIEINTFATKSWMETILEAKDKYSLYLTFWSDFHKENHNDNKHWDLWQLNPMLSEEFVKNCFMEYKDKLV